MEFKCSGRDREACMMAAPNFLAEIGRNLLFNGKKPSGKCTVLFDNIKDLQYSVRRRDSRADNNRIWYCKWKWWRVWNECYVIPLQRLWRQSITTEPYYKKQLADKAADRQGSEKKRTLGYIKSLHQFERNTLLLFTSPVSRDHKICSNSLHKGIVDLENY